MMEGYRVGQKNGGARIYFNAKPEIHSYAALLGMVRLAVRAWIAWSKEGVNPKTFEDAMRVLSKGIGVNPDKREIAAGEASDGK